MSSAFLQNFRALLPSWKFFDRVGVIPTFAFRANSEDWVSWTPHASTSFFINGEKNLELAKVSLLERVLAELNENVQPETYVDSVSYRLLRAWALEEVLRLTPSAHQFQFKVGFRDPKDLARPPEDILVSLEHEV